MHNNIYFKEKNHYRMKKKEILWMDIALFFQFFFIVMFHEPQTWGFMAVEKL